MVTVTLVVARPAGSPPSIALSATNVTLTVPEGTVNPAAGTVDVTNGGGGTLSGLAVGTITYGPEAANWLTADLSGTVAPATLTLGVTAASLVAGTYTATVPISSSLPGVSSQSVDISFEVTSSSPAVGILAASLTASPGGIAGPPSNLYVVEVSPTGQDVPRGRIQLADGGQLVITDLALSPSGTLYGISFTTLYTIDQATGEATKVGDLGLTENANGLTFDPSGKLFAATAPGKLYEVNVTTGQATEIGPFGGGLQSDGDIVFGPDGTLYGSAISEGHSVLIDISPTRGEARRVNPANALGVENVWGMAYFAGQLYGLTADPGTALGELVEIDVTSGVAGKVRDLSFDTGGASARRLR
jgi:hypothetical protein